LLLNRLEFALVNNPVRAALQRHYESRRLLRMAGTLRGGSALELGCGRGVGTELILDLFGADNVDAFDLDFRMLALARERLRARGSRVRLFVADASAIPAASASYDAVFDFGILHHVPDWRLALREVERVLKPGGRFYAEEVLGPFLAHPIVRRLFEHPQADRFDSAAFEAGLREAGLKVHAAEELLGAMAWFTATKAGTGAGSGLR
jgi:ubiquinone/menaquinone biosynthesis C-methylase UbiE